ncbi:BMP family ABC transporter substrate-binding protein [Carnobacteriaceae bacterium zg-84]|uniref:BMP family lipoprotein n=1 Tax=Granulicatella sp. zg-84 TaxID=2678503 RepID=UPI0013BEED4D|nr:BMP family ABC transporter substrate-binding protein [Granulicatella sp. zg-84]NEW65833.1 BMP family ABC transporter substrate-binding protein [Granulicatella sp. zg-84]QMI86370.1 BMP family ABC transporter substrate-binding protein [Carnobacteriaceae bacterium zg-84]
MSKSLKMVYKVVIALLVVVLAACSSQSSEKTDTKMMSDKNEKSSVRVGVVFTTAGLGGESFNDLVFEGVKRAKDDLGVEFDYVEPKSVSDQEITLDEMASSGKYQLVIAVGFEQVDAIKVVAKNYPEQKFALIDAQVDLPNVSCYVSREEEGTFLLGALAALVKKEGTLNMLNKEKVIGFIGGVESPLINKFAAGYTAGARYVDKDLTVLVDYAGSFNDPSTAKVIAETMHSKNADIVFHAAGASGMGLFQAAEEKGFLSMGVNSNQNKIKPDYIMASMLKLANQASYEVIKSVVENAYKPGINTLGLKQEGVGITLDKSNIKVSEDIVKTVDDIKKKIIDGSIEVPTALDKVDSFIESHQLGK